MRLTNVTCAKVRTGADIAFATRPQNTVAGDYYDAFTRPTPGGAANTGPLIIAVADVAGKSVPAALLMATFQASLRALAATPAFTHDASLLTSQDSFWLFGIGRLKQGISPMQAEADLRVLSEQLHKAHPESQDRLEADYLATVRAPTGGRSPFT